MFNREIISPEISPLEKSMTVERALHEMAVQELSQLPVVHEGHYEGLISEDDLLDMPSDALLADLNHDLLPFSVGLDEHFLSSARLMVSRQLKIVAVAGPDKEYIGAISPNDLLTHLTRLTGLMDTGALIVMEMEPHKFSIGEISRLVETNDAQITQLNTYIRELTGNMVITLRINRSAVSDIVASFQRYDYQVIYFSGEEHYENELRKNYNNLMNFLEM